MERLFLISLLILSLADITVAANYTLEIISPAPTLDTTSRWYKAYPGIEYKVPVGVYGGLYPFTYELTTSPAGMSIDEDTGIITWLNPLEVGSPHSVAVLVTDDESITDTISWTITVTDTVGEFIFVDSVNGVNSTYNGCTGTPDPCGTGTLANPFASMCDFYMGSETVCDSDPAMRNTDYTDSFVYFRDGTYEPEGFRASIGIIQEKIYYRFAIKPHVWLAYPGENPVFDYDLTTAGAYFDAVDGTRTGAFFHGIKFQDMRNHAWRVIDSGTTFFGCAFEDLGPGEDGQNSSFIMFSTKDSLGGNSHNFVKDNTFVDLNVGAFLKLYSLEDSVIEGNSFSLPSGSPVEGLALKSYNTNVSVRANVIDGDWADGSISGNMNFGEEFDISFNKVINASLALQINHDGTSVNQSFFERNTLEGIVELRRGDTGDGPFYLNNNVIINSTSSVTYHGDVNDQSVLILGTGADDNLFGDASDAIIDGNGDLTEAYEDQLGIKGYQLEAAAVAGSRFSGSGGILVNSLGLQFISAE